MSHPIIEIHFEDIRGEFEPVTKNWYHRPIVGDYIEITEPHVFIGRVVSVGWVEGEGHEYVVVRVK